MLRAAVLTPVLAVATLAAACAGAVVEPSPEDEVGTAAPAAAPSASAVPAASPAVAPPGAPTATQLVLVGRLADGRELTVAVASGRHGAAQVTHAMLAVGDDVTILDGGAGVRLEGFEGDGELTFGALTIEGNVRAVFGLAARRHAGAFGDRVFLEGSGTVGDVDVEVTGVLAELPAAANVLLVAAPPSTESAGDAWALVALAADAEVVVAEGTVGGELVPAYTLGEVRASDVVDAAPGVRRELVVVWANGRALAGVHAYTPECGR